MAFEATAVIVAGGLGTRARKMIGDDIPKALLPIGGIPIIGRQITALAEQGFSKIVILTGYLGHVLEEYIKSTSFPNHPDIILHLEAQALGTAGAVITARDLFTSQQLVVVFGDLLFDLDFAVLLQQHQQTHAAVAVVCRPNDHPTESDLVVVDDQGGITALLSKKNRASGDYRNLVPTGIYVVARAELEHFAANQRLDFFQDFFPQILKDNKKMIAARPAAYICDVGTANGRDAAEQDLLSGRVRCMGSETPRPTVFFDIDGVLNEDVPDPGVLAASDLQLITGAGAALRKLNLAGHLAIGITNRPQLAKGQLSRAGLEDIFARLDMKLADEKGYLDRIYFCPHHPEKGHDGEVAALKIACDCRKPAPGLLAKAMSELPIDSKQSAMVGDTWRDISAALSKGIYAYGVRTGVGCRNLPQGVQPDLMFKSVVEAVNFCLNYKKLATLISQKVDQCKSTDERFIVGIAGVSQAGKSCLAHALERYWRHMNRAVLRVNLDRWLVPSNERHGANVYERTRAARFAQIYQQLKAGDTVLTTGYDPFTRGSTTPTTYTAPAGALIIVEGVLACSAPGITQLDMSFFIDMPLEEAAKRQRELLVWKQLADTDIKAIMADRLGDEFNTILAQKTLVNHVINHLELDE
jgi:histidinol-phosphate phosphatase family protein